MGITLFLLTFSAVEKSEVNPVSFFLFEVISHSPHQAGCLLDIFRDYFLYSQIFLRNITNSSIFVNLHVGVILLSPTLSSAF